MNPHFQRVTGSDDGQLLSFVRELYAHEHIPWRDAETRRAVEELLRDQQRGGAWFIEVDRDRIGYFVLTLAFSVEFGGSFALLDELYIREQWTGKGIGQHVMRFAEEQAHAMGAHAIRLEAGHDNERAVRFYERFGFRREERYLMTKRLD